MKQPFVRKAELCKAWEASISLSALPLAHQDQLCTAVWDVPGLTLYILLLLLMKEEPCFPRLQVQQFEFSNGEKKPEERLHVSLQVRSTSRASPADAPSAAKAQGG